MASLPTKEPDTVKFVFNVPEVAAVPPKVFDILLAVTVRVGRVSLVTLSLPVVAAKNVLVWLVAVVAVVLPHVPLFFPYPPKVKLATV